MECPHQHKITLVSPKCPNVHVNHTFFLIRGHAETTCSNDQITVTSVKGSSKRQKIINGKFIVLWELEVGENLLTVQLCIYSVKLGVTLEYRDTKHVVVPMLIIPRGHDGTFQAPGDEDNSVTSACERIHTVMRLAQTVFAEKMNESNFGYKTFHLLSDLLPAAKCERFQSDLHVNEIESMSEYDMWRYFAEEIVKRDQIDEQKHFKRKYVAFLSSTRYDGSKYQPNAGHDDLLRWTRGYIALTGGNLTVFHTACLFTWPDCFDNIYDRFRDDSKIDRSLFLDDSHYRGTFSACFSTTFGAVCHEMGHLFDLGHTKTGVMSRGFDNIQKMFCISPTDRSQTFVDLTSFTKNCLVILNRHSFFNTNNFNDNRPVYLPKTHTVQSSNGLSIVEIREIDGEFVREWWNFSNVTPMHVFRIPQAFSPDNYVIFAMDLCGNVLKKRLSEI